MRIYTDNKIVDKSEEEQVENERSKRRVVVIIIVMNGGIGKNWFRNKMCCKEKKKSKGLIGVTRPHSLQKVVYKMVKGVMGLEVHFITG